ncbi:MAG: hypothetical protein ACOYOB_19575 [Myxococcota bacterium]
MGQIDELKARMEPPAAPLPPATAQVAVKRDLPDALRLQMEGLEAALAAQAAAAAAAAVPVPKTDLGPLPEKLRKKAPEVGETETGGRRDAFTSTKLREAIEKKCQPMDFGDLILTGRVLQRVPVLPGKLNVTYQSLLAHETYWIEREAVRRSDSPAGRSVWSVYARLALSIVDVNGTKLVDHLVDGKVSSDSFDEKFDRLMNLGDRTLELMFVNLSWFDKRVDKLYEDDFELLGNG